MTRWPTISEYKAALQHPARIFHDDWLQQSQPALDKNRLPFGISGGFGVVFPVTLGSAKKALKCFTEGDAGLLQGRYGAIDAYLHARGWPSFMVDFRYLTDAMLVQGRREPVLLMDWIDGPRLNAWLRMQIAVGNAGAIRAMADRWCALVLDLADRGIAHGDLQHGNVLVVGDQPVLVDYDGMFIPGTGAMPPEGGYPGYQHPHRATQQPSPLIDHFSAWVILLALRAAAADLTFFEPDDERLDDTLLFLESDLENPDDSWVWTQLARSPDPEVRSWAQALRVCLDQPFERIPAFRPRSRADLHRESECQKHLDLLRRLPGEPGESADRAFGDAWEHARAWLDEVREAKPMAERCRRALARLAVLDHLAAWLANPLGPGEDLCDLLKKLPIGYEFDLRAVIEPLRQDAARIRRTLHALLHGSASADAVIDYSCIRLHARFFHAHRHAVEQTAQAHIDRVTLRSSSADDETRLRWHWVQWSKSRYRCVYAVTTDRWLEHPDDGDPYRGEGCRTVEMDAYQRHLRHAGGLPIALPADADEAYVTIWPMLALGWCDVIGKPLRVGPVAVQRRGILQEAQG